MSSGGAQLSGAQLAGQPFVNAHYARQLQGWAAAMAHTGQNYDAATGRLELAPLCDGAGPGDEVRVPFWTPTALGHVVLVLANAGHTAALQVLSGELCARAIVVHLHRCGAPPPSPPFVSARPPACIRDSISLF